MKFHPTALFFDKTSGFVFGNFRICNKSFVLKRFPNVGIADIAIPSNSNELSSGEFFYYESSSHRILQKAIVSESEKQNLIELQKEIVFLTDLQFKVIQAIERKTAELEALWPYDLNLVKEISRELFIFRKRKRIYPNGYINSYSQLHSITLEAAFLEMKNESRRLKKTLIEIAQIRWHLEDFLLKYKWNSSDNLEVVYKNLLLKINAEVNLAKS